MLNEFVQSYSSNCITDTDQYIFMLVGMKRKLKDPKKLGEKKEQTVNNSGKNQETTTRWNRKEFACNIMERLVVGSEANE